MTFQKMLEDLTSPSNKNIQLSKVKSFLEDKEHRKIINYFIYRGVITKEPLNDNELIQLQSIVQILQILYNSDIGSPVSDENYDILQEMLVNMGIPRLTGSIEINDNSKVSHQYKTLRGTLDKVYYLTPDENRTNKSRKSLDDWIKSAENRYEKITGKHLDFNELFVSIQPKFDGVSCIAEISKNKILWLTRGDTKNNRASDVSHIMNIFNDIYGQYTECGIKFEVMMPEENMEKINKFYTDKPYKNSRQIVTSILNSNEVDFKADYLYPVPLRILQKGETLEELPRELLDKFPIEHCRLKDREIIRKYANDHRYVIIDDIRFRTDGCVITIQDRHIREVLGRENDINQYEVAYKFTEEIAQTTIKDVRFETSRFGFIAPVAVFNPVILKGNTVTHASLANKERFDELDLHYGDVVNISYDIIPYLTKDPQVSKGRKIEFASHCPSCGEELDLRETMVKCKNPHCISKIIGKILNYCINLRIQNIGYNTLCDLYKFGLLNKGILSLYKLKKKTLDMEGIDGFGRLKCKKIVAEIEAKRRLKDYEFFGALGITGLSTKTFEIIFRNVSYTKFMDMIHNNTIDMLYPWLLSVDGIGNEKANLLLDYLKDSDNRKKLIKLIEELTIEETYSTNKESKGKVVFSGIRPEPLMSELRRLGWEISNSVSKNTSYLIVKDKTGSSSKIKKAMELGIPILEVDEVKPETLGE